jgi:murein DD-endopeptidase MepM/ murein hydrolase activator NlpD
MGRSGRLDGLALVGLAFFAFMILNVLKDQGFLQAGLKPAEPAAAALAPNIDTVAAIGTGGTSSEIAEIVQTQPIDADAIAAPYDHFFVTQGIHGADYGHLAVDISSGKGATILSPINGEVTALFIDDWGNPSLILENARYKVELLHGDYIVKIGDRIAIGQPIGYESNQGNVADPWGFSCRNRDCGYHTHINVYDKSLGANVNPLSLFSPR